MIKLAVIGAGNVFKKVYLPMIEANEAINIVGMYDTENKDFPQFEGSFASLEELLNSTASHVLILSPNHTHFEYTYRALKARKHVLCEKPLCSSLHEYYILDEIASKSSASFFPAYNNIYREDITKLKQILENKSDLKEIRMAWQRKSGVPGNGSWFTQKQKALGGVLMDLGSHLFSVLNYLMEIDCYKVQDIKLAIMKNAESSWYEPMQDDTKHELDVETSICGKIYLNENVNLFFDINWDAPVDKDRVQYVFEYDSERIEYNNCFGFSPKRLINDEPIIVYQKNTMTKIPVRQQELHEYKRMFQSFLCGNSVNNKIAENTVSMIESIYGYI